MRALTVPGPRLWTLLLALALVAAACGGGGGDDAGDDAATTDEAAQADGGDDAGEEATAAEEPDDEDDGAGDDAVEDPTEPADSGDVGAAADEVAIPEEVALTDAQRDEVSGMGLTFAINTNNNTDDFSRTIVAGAQDAADALGIELISQSADFDANTQLSQIDALVQQGVDAIFLIAVDADAVSTGVLAANDAGIPVLIVGGPPTRGEVVTVLNAASLDGARESAALLADAIGEGGTAALLQIPLALQVIEDRDTGATEGLEAGGVEIVAQQASFEQDELLAQAESIIEANPDLGGIYATWSLAINAALAAVEGSDILVAGHDAERTGFEAFDEGSPNLVALTAQQPYVQGWAGIQALVRDLLGESVPEALDVPNLLVTPDNYRDQWATLYPGLTPPWEE